MELTRAAVWGLEWVQEWVQGWAEVLDRVLAGWLQVEPSGLV